MPLRRNGFGFDAEALSIRIAAECQRLGITTRAQAISAWAGLADAQRIKFLAKLLLGACRFPDDATTANAYQVGAAPTVPGAGQ